MDGYVLRLPEGVLGIEDGVADFHVLAVLEGIIALVAVVPDPDVAAVEEEVVALGEFDVLQLEIPAEPEGLVGMGDLDILQGCVLHLPEHLRRLDEGVAHLEVAAVPERGAGALPEDAVLHGETVRLPERILAAELAAIGLDAGAFLEGGFARVDGDVLQPEVPGDVERPFAAEFGILDDLHVSSTNYERAKLAKKRGFPRAGPFLGISEENMYFYRR